MANFTTPRNVRIREKGTAMRLTTTLLTPRILGILLAVALAAVVPVPASAHPEACEEQHEDGIGLHGHETCYSEEEIAGFDDSGANLRSGEVGRTRNMHLLANLPKSGPFAGQTNSDIAFWGDYAIQGNYNGIQITDISDPTAPRVVSQIHCPGSQNDVSVWGHLIFTSTDSTRNKAECDGNVSQSGTSLNAWEGIRVFDWSDPAAPTYVTGVKTDCGSHTHTLLPEPEAARVLLYVSSYSPSATTPNCLPPHDKISVVEVPLLAPGTARVIAEPVLFPTGGQSSTSGCHDITVYPAIGLGAGACMGEGIILDISDPVAPSVVSTVTDPNFVFWHSATFSNDGSKVIFTDERGGGGQPTCNPTVGGTRGADAIYDISDPAAPAFLSYFKIPRTQSNTENCVAHNGNVLPTAERDIFVQAWYQGGTSVIDFTDPRNPREIGFWDRGPVDDRRLVTGGAWSSYFYNGLIFSNEITQGLDVFKLSDSVASKANGVRLPYLNAQTQEPLPAR